MFRSKMAIWPEWEFFQKSHLYNSHVHIGPFHCAKYQKILERIKGDEDKPFLGPKWPVSPERFFQKIDEWNLSRSFMSTCIYSRLFTCKKSESDVHPLMRYCHIKNTEIWFARGIFGHNLKTRFFPRVEFSQSAKGS